MPTIGMETLEVASALIESLLRTYRRDIDSAYIKEESALTIALSLKFKPADDGGVTVEAGLNFVKDRIKDSVSRNITEGQGSLFARIDDPWKTKPEDPASVPDRGDDSSACYRCEHANINAEDIAHPLFTGCGLPKDEPCVDVIKKIRDAK